MKRRLITSPKFYFFDLSPVIHLTQRRKVVIGSELFGRAFEQFIWMELRAFSSYSELFFPLSYWRTSAGIEVDFVLGDHEVIVEVKSTGNVQNNHLKGMRRFLEDYSVRRPIVVSLDPAPRKTTDNIEILPWDYFLKHLWAGKII